MPSYIFVCISVPRIYHYDNDIYKHLKNTYTYTNIYFQKMKPVFIEVQLKVILLVAIQLNM